MRQFQIKLDFVFKIIRTPMPLDKVLHKIQLQIKDLAPTLELFIDETIQPTADDCESLQKQLHKLLENIAVYKFDKIDRELSPSFHLHAKVSEKQIVEEPVKVEIPTIEKQIVAEIVIESLKPETPVVQETPKEEVPIVEKQKQALTVGLNDKFRFINELFSQNAAEYNIAIEQLNNLKSWTDSEIYLNSLKSLYNWKDESDAVKYFYSLAKKRF